MKSYVAPKLKQYILPENSEEVAKLIYLLRDAMLRFHRIPENEAGKGWHETNKSRADMRHKFPL